MKSSQIRTYSEERETAAPEAANPALPSLAFLLPGLRQGGSELVTLRLATAFAKLGHRVSVVSLLKNHVELSEHESGAFEYVYLEASRTSLSLLHLRKFIKSWKPDLIVSSQPHVSLLLILLRQFSRGRFKVVIAEHAPIMVQAQSNQRWRYQILPYLIPTFYARADALVTVSAGIAEEMKRLVPKAKRIRLIYNPVFDASITLRAASKLSSAYADSVTRPTVLSVGRLAPEKDFSTLLKAFALLRRRMDARLVILGEGPMRKELAAQAEALGIAADLFMPGFVDNPMPFMAQASVLVVSSIFEGFGNVLVEAMACGTQVVSTDAPTGPREILGANQWGRLVTVGDAASLADGLLQAIESPIEAASLRLRAAAFSADASIARYQSLFAEIVSEAESKTGIMVRTSAKPSALPSTERSPTLSELASLARHPNGRPLKIAIYVNDMSGGGAERMILTLINAFRAAGAEVELILHSAKGELLSQVPRDIFVTSFETSRVSKDVLPIASFLRRSKPDILLTGLNHNNIIACVAGMISRRKSTVVITQHNALTEESLLHGNWKYRVVPYLYRLIAPFAGGIVAVSEGVAVDLAKTCHIDRKRIDRIYNPIFNTELVARSLEPVEHPWFQDHDVPVFVTAGRLVKQKDHATLLRAFALYRRNEAGRLMILGNGPLLEPCRDLARELGISDDVDFVGFKENPLPYYRKSRAFVLSSAYEGFGNVLVEAMACGVPVISTDCPYGPSEILDGGRYGRLAPVGDAAALAAVMDPELRKHFPAAELERRAAQFSIEASATTYLKMFQRMIQKAEA